MKIQKKAGMEKKVDNCAWCIDYPCSKLEFIFENAPEAKERLNGIKS